MMKRILLTTACVLLTSAAALAEVTVAPLRVEESRSCQISEVKGVHPISHFGGNDLTVELLLSGPEVVTATQIKEIAITSATDDAGTTLKSGAQRTNGGFHNLNRKFMWFFMKNPPADKIKVKVKLTAPARKATRLTHLEGSVTLRCGTSTQILIPAVVGKATNKLLQQAGATVEVTKVEPGRVRLDIEDPQQKLHDYELVDKTGKKIQTGSSGWGGARTIVTLDSDHVSPGSSIKLQVITRTTEHKVPFKLQNIPLP